MIDTPPLMDAHVAALGMVRGEVGRFALEFVAAVRAPVAARDVAAALVKGRIAPDHPSHAYIFATLVPTALGRLAPQGRLMRQKISGKYQYWLPRKDGPRGA